MKIIGCIALFFLGSFSSPAQSPASFAYVLQADTFARSKPDAVTRLAACDRDWIILDAHFSNREPWTAADLSKIRTNRPGRKIVAYLSIGEAEDYRAYWHPDWDADHDGKPDAGAPDFLLTENPEWKGNYRVKYWRPQWQETILREVDQIMAAGFDGVYLDIVDGFETFERGKDDRLNPETGQSYRRDMVDWVKAVAARARKTDPSALVIPQNGTQLFAHPDFLATVDAAGVEDLFTEGDKEQNRADTAAILGYLAPLESAHKPVLDVEYATRKALCVKVRSESAQHHLVLLITDRQLTTLGQK